jgi:hypothetical protein
MKKFSLFFTLFLYTMPSFGGNEDLLIITHLISKSTNQIGLIGSLKSFFTSYIQCCNDKPIITAACSGLALGSAITATYCGYHYKKCNDKLKENNDNFDQLDANRDQLGAQGIANPATANQLAQIAQNRGNAFADYSNIVFAKKLFGSLCITSMIGIALFGLPVYNYFLSKK